MLMVIFMMVSELQIKLMVMEFIRILMELCMKDNERKINSMEREKKNGLMELNMKAIIF